MNKKKFFVQGFSLAILAVVMRSGNIFYRSYLSHEVGAEGMGLYQLVFSIFVLAVTLSTSGISLAVTRLVSSCIARDRRDQIRSLVNKCLGFCLSLSLIISLIFFFFSDFLAYQFLGNISLSPSLKILGIGLPFMSLCTCMKGYFLAVDEGVSSGVADLFEQIITIGGTVVIFSLFSYESIEQACMYSVIASTIGEMVSFSINYISVKLSLRRHTPKKKSKSTGVMKGMTHIALPCTFSSAARSLLTSAENLLIPWQLQRSGLSYSSSLVQYGVLQGMALPMLYFPSAFIWPFAILLIPKICKEKEQSHKNAVSYVTTKAVSTVVSFGVITASIFFVFSGSMSEIFYGNREAGLYTMILAPLIPLMYLDIVVDSLLKGLDEQLHSMKFNIIDSALRVVLILLLMNRFGVESYIYIIFFSTIFNAGLSVSKLIKVARPKLSVFLKVFYQVPLAVISVKFAELLFVESNPVPSLIICFALSYLLYVGLNIICSKYLDKSSSIMYNGSIMRKDGKKANAKRN